MSVSKLNWLVIVVESYAQDPRTKKLITELSNQSPNDKGYTLYDGVITYNNMIWLGNHQEATL
jgi:hypothetical protein